MVSDALALRVQMMWEHHFAGVMAHGMEHLVPVQTVGPEAIVLFNCVPVMEHGTAADVIVTPVCVGVIAQRGISCIIPKIKNRGGFPRFFFYN